MRICLIRAICVSIVKLVCTDLTQYLSGGLFVYCSKIILVFQDYSQSILYYVQCQDLLVQSSKSNFGRGGAARYSLGQTKVRYSAPNSSASLVCAPRASSRRMWSNCRV